MAQGGFKKSSGGGKPSVKKGGVSGKLQKQMKRDIAVKKGSAVKLPRVGSVWRESALESRALSKAIDVSNEQKVAAKLLQGGGKLKTADILARGKELAKDNRRSQVSSSSGPQHHTAVLHTTALPC